MSASGTIDGRATAAYPRKPITSMCMLQQVGFAKCSVQCVVCNFETAMVCYLLIHNLADIGQTCGMQQPICIKGDRGGGAQRQLG